jgi:hypothetical protein
MPERIAEHRGLLARTRSADLRALGRRATVWVPLALMAAYLVLVAIEFHQFVDATNWFSDSSASYVIAQTLGSAPSGRHVVLGQFGWYTTLWFFLVTKGLPLHRQIWEAVPYIVALLGAGLVSWASWRAIGRRAALLTLVVLVCASPDVLVILLSPTLHTSTYFTVSLLAAYLVLLATVPRARRGPYAVAGAVGVGLMTGANAASDSLAWIAAVGPFVLAGVGLWGLRRTAAARQVALAVLATSAVTAIAGAVASAVMRADGFSTKPPRAVFASFEQTVNNVKLLVQVVLKMGGGSIFEQRVGGHGLLTLACAAIALIGVAIPFVLLWRLVREPATAEPDAALGRPAFVLFWGLCAVLVVVGVRARGGGRARP